jgi:hypothetical protein
VKKIKFFILIRKSKSFLNLHIIIIIVWEIKKLNFILVYFYRYFKYFLFKKINTLKKIKTLKKSKL